jgi:voltage-gated potassium channel
MPAPIDLARPTWQRLRRARDGEGELVDVGVRQDESGWVWTPLEPVVLASALALVPVMVVEADAKGGWQTTAVVANWLIWFVFALELSLIFVAAGRRRAALRAHWLDVAIVLFTVPLLGRLLAMIRLLRLLRLTRLLRLGAVVGRAIRSERSLSSGETFRLLALFTGFIVVVAGAAEATFDTADFPSIWSGVWWAVVTVTTVGYGDLYPRSVAGRLIGIAVMFVGIGFLSVLTATIASHFVKAEQGDTDDELLARLDRIEQTLLQLHAAQRMPSSRARS